MSTLQNTTIHDAIKTQTFILDCLITAQKSSGDPTIHNDGVAAQQQLVSLLKRAVAA